MRHGAASWNVFCRPSWCIVTRSRIARCRTRGTNSETRMVCRNTRARRPRPGGLGRPDAAVAATGQPVAQLPRTPGVPSSQSLRSGSSGAPPGQSPRPWRIPRRGHVPNCPGRIGGAAKIGCRGPAWHRGWEILQDSVLRVLPYLEVPSPTTWPNWRSLSAAPFSTYQPLRKISRRFRSAQGAHALSPCTASCRLCGSKPQPSHGPRKRAQWPIGPPARLAGARVPSSGLPGVAAAAPPFRRNPARRRTLLVQFVHRASTSRKWIPARCKSDCAVRLGSHRA